MQDRLLRGLDELVQLTYSDGTEALDGMTFRITRGT
jgi:hypothetical protein